MTVYCLAQVLPLHIVQAIAGLLQNTGAATYYNQNMSTAVKKSLIPPMSVCRHWNVAISSLFYHSATLQFGDEKAAHENSRPVLTLDDVATINKLSHLRKLQIYVSEADFTGTDNNPTVQLSRFLDAYGPLPSVKEITVGFGKYRSTTGSAGQSADSSFKTGAFTMDELNRKLSDFLDCFHKLLPSKRIFSVHRVHSLPQNILSGLFTQTMTDMLLKLLGQDVSHISFSNLTLKDQFVSSLQACALRHIKLARVPGSKQHMELVRRNCASLEYLLLDYLSIDCILNPIGLMASGDKIPVYPRLKKLYIGSCYGDGKSDLIASAVNPFPALEIFTCSDFTHSALITILGHIRHTVRVLTLDINRRLLEEFTDHGIFEAESFKRLQTLLLREIPRSGLPLSAQTNDMLVGALRISSIAHSVSYKIYRPTMYSEDTLSSIVFSDSLRLLNIENMQFTVGQAVQLLSGFRRLYKAALSLKEESSTRVVKMPTVEEIQQFQTRFKGQPSSVRVVQLFKTNFFNQRRAGEYIVMMVDALTSVEQVVIKDTRDSQGLKILNGVDFSLKRSVYQGDAHLGSVVYSIEDF